MADKNTAITQSIEQIRTAIYGKDVREAIASGIELCYDYVGGQRALDAAQRAEQAVDELQGVVIDSADALDKLNQAVNDVGELIVVSETQPTNPENKIWIKPQADQEYKVATFDAYAALWNQVDDMKNVFDDGHGGIKSITVDQEYADEDETDLPFEERLKKRYVITYADNTTSDFYVSDGAVGKIGPPDNLETYFIELRKVTAEEVQSNPDLIKKAPISGWVRIDDKDTGGVPELSSGDWLWVRTTNVYESGQTSIVYSLCRQGLDGMGAVDSVRLGKNGTPRTKDVEIPVDDTLASGGTGVALSGTIYNAINAAIANAKVNTALTGAPTAPTASAGTNTTQIATTAFVDNAVKNTQINKDELFASPYFTGVPSADTAEVGTNTTQLATTEFVQTAAENAATNALFGFRSFTLDKKSNTDNKRFIIGIPPATRHLVIFSSSAIKSSAVMLIYCSMKGTVNILTLGKGADMVLEPNYESRNTPVKCAIRITVGAGDLATRIYDLVMYKSSATPTWEDASIKENAAQAQAFLS